MLAQTKQFRHAEGLDRGEEGYRSREVRMKDFKYNSRRSRNGWRGRKARRSWQCAGGGDCAINGKKLDLRLDPTKILSVSYSLHIEIYQIAYQTSKHSEINIGDSGLNVGCVGQIGLGPFGSCGRWAVGWRERGLPGLFTYCGSYSVCYLSRWQRVKSMLADFNLPERDGSRVS